MAGDPIFVEREKGSYPDWVTERDKYDVLRELSAGRKAGVYKTIEKDLDKENTNGRLYYIRDMTWTEIAKYWAHLFEDPGLKDDARSPPHEDKPIDPNAQGRDQMDQRIQNLHYDPHEYVGLKASVFGIDAIDYGDVSTEVEGKEFEVGEGYSVTVDKHGNIAAVSYNHVTIASDGRALVTYDKHHVKVTGALQMGKAATTALGAGVEAGIHSKAADNTLQHTEMSDKQFERQQGKDANPFADSPDKPPEE